jgi:hypothetical protein
MRVEVRGSEFLASVDGRWQLYGKDKKMSIPKEELSIGVGGASAEFADIRVWRGKVPESWRSNPLRPGPNDPMNLSRYRFARADKNADGMLTIGEFAPVYATKLTAQEARTPFAESDQDGDGLLSEDELNTKKAKAIKGIAQGANVRIIPLAKPLNSEDGYAQWMYPEDYTAQDILELIEGLKPQVLERFFTGKQNIDARVPVRAGHPPMTVKAFLNASLAAGGPDCVIIPKLNLTWISWGREKYFWETAENNFNLPLKRPIRIVNLDNWKGFLEKHGEAKAIALLKRLKQIGYERIGVNMAGGFNQGYGYLSFGDFLINSETWEIRVSTLNKMKQDHNFDRYFLYIDYPGQLNEFMELSVDQQADVFTKVIEPAESTHGFTFVYPVLFDSWDATKQFTSKDGAYHGDSIYDVIRKSVHPYPSTAIQKTQ